MVVGLEAKSRAGAWQDIVERKGSGSWEREASLKTHGMLREKRRTIGFGAGAEDNNIKQPSG